MKVGRDFKQGNKEYQEPGEKLESKPFLFLVFRGLYAKK